MIRHQDSDWYRLRVSGEAIEVTDAHPFYVRHRGWVLAKDLRAGMQLKTLGGDGAELLSIHRINRTARAYNFTVAGLHTYFVGRSELLVHNSSCGTSANYAIREQIGARSGDVAHGSVPDPSLPTGPVYGAMRVAAGVGAFTLTVTAVAGPFVGLGGDSQGLGPTLRQGDGQGGLTFQPDYCPADTGCVRPGAGA